MSTAQKDIFAKCEELGELEVQARLDSGNWIKKDKVKHAQRWLDLRKEAREGVNIVEQLSIANEQLEIARSQLANANSQLEIDRSQLSNAESQLTIAESQRDIANSSLSIAQDDLQIIRSQRTTAIIVTIATVVIAISAVAGIYYSCDPEPPKQINSKVEK